MGVFYHFNVQVLSFKSQEIEFLLVNTRFRENDPVKEIEEHSEK